MSDISYTRVTNIEPRFRRLVADSGPFNVLNLDVVSLSDHDAVTHDEIKMFISSDDITALNIADSLEEAARMIRDSVEDKVDA